MPRSRRRFHLLLSALVLAVPSKDVHGQAAVQRPADGPTIRVHADFQPPLSVVGRYVDLGPDSLAVWPARAREPLAFAADDIQRVQVAAGRDRAAGAVVGGMLATAAWLAMVASSESSTAALGFLWTPLAFGGGALVGSAIGLGQRWEETSFEQLRAPAHRATSPGVEVPFAGARAPAPSSPAPVAEPSSVPDAAVAAPSPSAGPPSDTLYAIVLQDGSKLIGRVQRLDGDERRIRTVTGVELTLDERLIRGMAPARGRVVAGEFWRADSNPSRLFFGPTARALPQGTAYFAVHELYMPMLAVGVTDRLTLAGGTPIIAPGSMFYFAPKLNIVDRERLDVAAGTLAFFGRRDSYSGVIYGAATVGTEDRAVTVGSGWGFSDGGLGSRPALMLGGELRESPSIKLISENYIIPTGDGTLVLASAGIRFLGEALTADVGIGYLAVDGGGFCCVPLVNFVWAMDGDRRPESNIFRDPPAPDNGSAGNTCSEESCARRGDAASVDVRAAGCRAAEDGWSRTPPALGAARPPVFCWTSWAPPV